MLSGFFALLAGYAKGGIFPVKNVFFEPYKERFLEKNIFTGGLDLCYNISVGTQLYT